LDAGYSFLLLAKLDESEESLDYVDAEDARERKYNREHKYNDECDETKLEDAYHDFIDKKLKDWFDKKTIGELTNDEKKIFFGRIKRTWPKKKKELGFVD
jgi:DNA replication initiation complex subunit (GINS family)